MEFPTLETIVTALTNSSLPDLTTALSTPPLPPLLTPVPPHPRSLLHTALTSSLPSGSLVLPFLPHLSLPLSPSESQEATNILVFAAGRNVPPATLQALLGLGLDPLAAQSNGMGNSALLAAALKGRLDVVDLLLEAGSAVHGDRLGEAMAESVSDTGGGVLHKLAAATGRRRRESAKRAWAAIVEAVGEESAKVLVGSVDKVGDSVFHKIGRQGNVGLLEDVMGLVGGNGADELGVKNAKGRTPVHEAACYGQADVLEIMVGACPGLVDVEDGEGKSPLYYVGTERALGSDVRCARVLLDAGASPSGMLHNPRASLEMGEVLVEAGADVNEEVGEERVTPLMAAYGAGNVARAAWLVQAGGEWGRVVAGNDPREVLKWVVTHGLAGEWGLETGGFDGSDAVGCVVEGRSLAGLELAFSVLGGESGWVEELGEEVAGAMVFEGARGGYVGALEILVGAYPQVLSLMSHPDAGEARFADSGTALHYAAQADEVEAVRFLVEAGSDLEAREPGFGYTALMAAVRRNAVGAVRELVGLGADVDAVCGEGVGVRELGEIAQAFDAVDALTSC